MKHGAINRPDHPAGHHALPIGLVLARAPMTVPDWFDKWNWPATGNILGNGYIGDCVEAADVVLVQGFAASMGIVAVTGADATTLAETRYEQISGWNGKIPGNDPGTIPQVDAFAWATVPIATSPGRTWPVRWATLDPREVPQALRSWPLLLTLGLCEDDEDDPDLWHTAPTGQFTEQHRVVCGAMDKSALVCRTYGFDVPVHQGRVIGADMMIHVATPAAIQTAGLDWGRITLAA